MELSIKMNLETRQIECQLPNDVVLTLGLLEYLHEAVMARTVRPALEPKIVTPGPVLNVPGE